MKKIFVVLSVVLVSMVLILAYTEAAAPPPSERVFHINAIEIKGGTSKDKLAPPDINPETLGKTYSYKAPGSIKNDPTRWEVGSYQFNPSAMTVWQGDRVKLVLFVVNGDVHKDKIVDPDGVTVVAETEHNRGRLYEITFVAKKAGFYKLRCDEHKENMTAMITVLPR